MWVRRRVAEVQLGLMLLSRLPAGRISGDVPPVGAAAWAFPVAGLAVGLAGGIVLLAAQALGLPPVMGAVLALGAMVLATGGLHEDGLADSADGLGGGRDVDHKLAIMRDSRIGSYGVIALVLALGLRVSGLMAVAGRADMVLCVVAVAMASRAAMPFVLALLPPARADGLGHMAAEGGEGYTPALAGLAIACLPLLALGNAGLVLLVVMVLASVFCGWLALRLIGGQTGDILGATQQAAELAAWVALAAMLR